MYFDHYTRSLNWLLDCNMDRITERDLNPTLCSSTENLKSDRMLVDWCYKQTVGGREMINSYGTGAFPPSYCIQVD